MPKYKTEIHQGLETILNNDKASFIKNPEVFKNILKETGLPPTQLTRQLAKMKKSNELSDKQKSEQRLNNLESKINSE